MQAQEPSEPKHAPVEPSDAAPSDAPASGVPASISRAEADLAARRAREAAALRDNLRRRKQQTRKPD